MTYPNYNMNNSNSFSSARSRADYVERERKAAQEHEAKYNLLVNRITDTNKLVQQQNIISQKQYEELSNGNRSNEIRSNISLLLSVLAIITAIVLRFI